MLMLLFSSGILNSQNELIKLSDLKPFDRVIVQSDTLILFSHKALKFANYSISERNILRLQVDSLNKVVGSCVKQVENYEVYSRLLADENILLREKNTIWKNEAGLWKTKVRYWQILTAVASGLFVWQVVK